MNIIFVEGTYPSYGGVERVTTVLANAFVKLNNTVHIVSFEQPNPEIAEKELDKRVQIHKLNYPIVNDANLSKLKSLISSTCRNILFSQWAVQYKINKLCHLACENSDSKLVVVHHNLPNKNNRIQKIEDLLLNSNGLKKCVGKFILAAVTAVSKWSLKKTYDYSDLYVTLSPSFMPIAESFMGLKRSDKMCSMYNPITRDVEAFDLESKKNEVLYVGRIEYKQKKTFRILEIWDKMQNQCPEWNLTFVGDGPDCLDLQAKAQGMNLERVNFEGYKDPISYYKRAKILILTSDFEGFPLVIGEAMAYGCVPVVLDSFAAVHDIVDDKRNGIIIPLPFNESLMANSIIPILKNDELLKQYAVDAIQKSKSFDIEEIANKWISLFQRL